MWKKVLREYFAFPRKERKGLWLLFIIWLSLLCYKAYTNKYYVYIFDEENYHIEELSEYDKEFYNPPTKEYTYTFKPSILKATKFSLDSLGISQAKYDTLLKDIQQKDSLRIQALGYLSDADKQQLINHFYIPKWITTRKQKTYKQKAPSTIEQFSINTCDSIMLESLPTIGPSTASRIIRYRNRLGGFHSISQLNEVYALDSISFSTLKKYCFVDNNFRKINLNTCSLEELKTHPYIGYKLANIIINYRAQHGSFTKAEDLLNIHVMNEEILRKIEVYLLFDND
jgi:competence protein ComEA